MEHFGCEIQPCWVMTSGIRSNRKGESRVETVISTNTCSYQSNIGLGDHNKFEKTDLIGVSARRDAHGFDAPTFFLNTWWGGKIASSEVEMFETWAASSCRVLTNACHLVTCGPKYSKVVVPNLWVSKMSFWVPSCSGGPIYHQWNCVYPRDWNGSNPSAAGKLDGALLKMASHLYQSEVLDFQSAWEKDTNPNQKQGQMHRFGPALLFPVQGWLTAPQQQGHLWSEWFLGWSWIIQETSGETLVIQPILLVGGPGPPLWKMMDFVNWDDDSNPLY